MTTDQLCKRAVNHQPGVRPKHSYRKEFNLYLFCIFNKKIQKNTWKIALEALGEAAYKQHFHIENSEW